MRAVLLLSISLLATACQPGAGVDVLVVGAGPAGLAAATEASQAGASVLVLEREAEPGGAARWVQGGHFLFAGTTEQVEAGVKDAGQRLLQEWPSFTGGDATDPWVQRFTLQGRHAVQDWLQAFGLSFTLHECEAEGQGAVSRLHSVDGAGEELVNVLVDQLPADSLRMETEVQDLLRNADGAVVGVRAEDGVTGEPLEFTAAAVVVATGGFLRNLDLVAWARPELDTSQLWFSTGPGADGMGHALLAAHGVTWSNPSAIGVYAHGIQDPDAPGEELMYTLAVQCILVNTRGERFVDETLENSFTKGEAVLAQPGQLAWAIFDADVRTRMSLADPMLLDGEEGVPDMDSLEEAGLLFQGNTIEALATILGVDGARLHQELDQFNDAMRTGNPDLWRGTAEPVRPIEVPPYFAFRVVPVLAKAFGGMAVDADGRVLDVSQIPIPGLYGAGELTGMAGGSIVGDRYFNGSFSAVVLSGRVAGAAAATEALD